MQEILEKFGKELAADEQAGGAEERPPIALGETHAGLDFLAETQALLLIAIDALAAAGGDVFAGESDEKWNFWGCLCF